MSERLFMVIGNWSLCASLTVAVIYSSSHRTLTPAAILVPIAVGLLVLAHVAFVLHRMEPRNVGRLANTLIATPRSDKLLLIVGYLTGILFLLNVLSVVPLPFVAALTTFTALLFFVLTYKLLRLPEGIVEPSRRTSLAVDKKVRPSVLLLIYTFLWAAPALVALSVSSVRVRSAVGQGEPLAHAGVIGLVSTAFCSLMFAASSRRTIIGCLLLGASMFCGVVAIASLSWSWTLFILSSVSLIGMVIGSWTVWKMLTALGRRSAD